jgi:hypothetical protein
MYTSKSRPWKFNMLKRKEKKKMKKLLRTEKFWNKSYLPVKVT